MESSRRHTHNLTDDVRTQSQLRNTEDRMVLGVACVVGDASPDFGSAIWSEARLWRPQRTGVCRRCPSLRPT